MAAAAPASRDRAASANGDAPRANGRRGAQGGARGRCRRRLRPQGGAGAGAGPPPQRSRDSGEAPAGHRGARGPIAAPSCPAATAPPGPAPEEGEGEAAVAGPALEEPLPSSHHAAESLYICPSSI
ncbi:collagen alpha-1(I) chain-like [Prinia subflava]|uniref:collagen alpha-1(I) chain-like n=1 Tax=Prinia subflava TaxID=208062 RepID=UPI002FDFAA8B